MLALGGKPITLTGEQGWQPTLIQFYLAVESGAPHNLRWKVVAPAYGYLLIKLCNHQRRQALESVIQQLLGDSALLIVQV